MRIIKRGRRHIVIHPGGTPLEERERKALEPGKRDAVGVVHFDQLPDALRQVLSSRPSAAPADTARDRR
jgi:hypothetical protein